MISHVFFSLYFFIICSTIGYDIAVWEPEIMGRPKVTA